MNTKHKFIALLSLGVATLVVACGGGKSTLAPPVAGIGGTIRGVVADNFTGTPIAGATVTMGMKATTTGADGSYEITGAPTATRSVVNITAPNYAQGSQVTDVFDGTISRVDAELLPVALSATVTNSIGGTFAVSGSTASVQLPANALTSASGAAPSGNVTMSVTPIDPSSNPRVMPGDFTAIGGSAGSGGQIETYGAMDVTMRDASGTAVNLASGQSSTIRIPVAAAATAPPATMEAWHYNNTTGQWVSEGTLTLGGIAPNQYYEGVVTHFSNWNADKKLSTTCITGKVVDSAGSPVVHARVNSLGQGYVGTSSTYTAADGSFTIQIKALASAIISAKTATAQSNSVTVMGGAAGTTCTAMTSDLLISASAAGSATIKLTWGANPQDLDSHLTGPNPDGTRFHIYYGLKGSLTVPPFANLDVDNTTGFGPEVITINTFTPGVYRYTVDHYSGSSTIAASPARVELSLNGVTSVFTPPSCATTRDWVVMELTASSAGVTKMTINSCVTAVPAAKPIVGTNVGDSKPPIASGNW